MQSSFISNQVIRSLKDFYTKSASVNILCLRDNGKVVMTGQNNTL